MLLSICRSVLLLWAQLIKKAKEEAGASYQVVSPLGLPGGWLCSPAAPRDFSPSLLLYQPVLAANWSPLQLSPQLLLLSLHWSWTLMLEHLSAGHLKHPDSYDLGITACFSCSPHPKIVFFHSTHSGGAPQLIEGSSLFHSCSCYELCKFPWLHPLFLIAGKKLLLSSIHSHPVPKRHSWILNMIIPSTCPTEESELVARAPHYTWKSQHLGLWVPWIQPQFVPETLRNPLLHDPVGPRYHF